jgi:hypothetical protein
MNSITKITGIHGNSFDVGVIHADELRARAPANENLELPDRSRISLLTVLPVAKNPADREELAILLGELFALDERVKQFAKARLAEQYAGWQAEHELARKAVREQLGVLEKLGRTLAEDSQEFSRAKNQVTQAETAARNEEQNLKGLSLYASNAERAAAEKRVIEANEKRRAAEVNAGRHGQALNSLLQVTIPGEEKKRDSLMERERELRDLLAGRDPFFGKFSFQQR